MKEYGKFDDNVEEYIITDPHTPVKWTNYIGTLAIFIAHDHPSIHLEYKYLMDTVINTYESIDATYPKLVQLVMGGEIKNLTASNYVYIGNKLLRPMQASGRLKKPVRRMGHLNPSDGINQYREALLLQLLARDV